MERIAQEFFSMRMMVVALFVFLVAIGLATFAETVYDTQTARLMVYDAGWFEVLLLYLCAGMIANIIRYRMFRAEKIAILTFHIAFIIMIIGAAVTRYFGFEGMMIIGEGETVAHMYSSDPYLVVEVTDGKESSRWGRKLLMSEALNPEFVDDVPLSSNGQVIKNASLHCVDYEKNMIDSLVTRNDIKETALAFAIGTDQGMQTQYLEEGKSLLVGAVPIFFEVKEVNSGVQIWKDGNKFKMKSEAGIRSLAMTELRAIQQSGEAPPDSMYNVVMPDSVITLEKAKLYNVQGQQFVLQEIMRHTKSEWMKAPKKDAGIDLLKVRLKVDGELSEVLEVPGGMSRIGSNTGITKELKGLTFTIEYGSKVIPMPFSVRCEDFRLERYPGSTQPSSFESDLTIIDKANNYKKTRMLFMNNVIDYAGYRLFQSSYEPDESGTRLQVNFDKWGTNISYFGYLLMGLGMFLALIAPAGRTRELIRKIKVLNKKRNAVSMIALLLSLSMGTYAAAQDTINNDPQNTDVEAGHEGHNHAPGEHVDHNHGPATDSQQPKDLNIKFPEQGDLYIMTEEHSKELAQLLVHSDIHKRAMPFHTLAGQLMRKIHRGDTYKDYNAVQVIMSMHMNPEYWLHEKVIYVSSKGDLRKSLGIKKYASLKDLVNTKTGEFIFADEAAEAFRKAESKRDEREKQIVKLQERFFIMMNMRMQDWPYLRIVPFQGEKGEDWLSLGQVYNARDTVAFNVAISYFGILGEATRGKAGYSEASDKLTALKNMQRDRAKSDIPSETMIDMEIAYNNMKVVKQAYRAYGVNGVLLLVFFLVALLSAGSGTPKWVRVVERVLFWLAVLATVYLATGLVFRAIISGHVPWSDGYEALVFISLVAAVIGVLLYRVNKVILAAACILAFLLLFVSDLNILDPEISKLQPVLKSYWLKIHVAIITGSYAPLGIAAVLGFINLILYIGRNNNNSERLKLVIKQITYITEISITIGVVMLTVGTFLGGVWANESWGRYWGWDPKETWALVAILAYAIILHLRFIPGVKDQFTFNAVSLWGYSTILFTFFGVNFYLVGLHSYANGEGLAEFPAWLSLVGAGFYFFTEFASFRNQRFKHQGSVIPTVYFTRKLVILGTMALGVALMMLIFKISPFVTVATNTGIILGLIVFATGLQFVFRGTTGGIQKPNEILD